MYYRLRDEEEAGAAPAPRLPGPTRLTPPTATVRVAEGPAPAAATGAPRLDRDEDAEDPMTAAPVAPRPLEPKLVFRVMPTLELAPIPAPPATEPAEPGLAGPLAPAEPGLLPVLVLVVAARPPVTDRLFFASCACTAEDSGDRGPLAELGAAVLTAGAAAPAKSSPMALAAFGHAVKTCICSAS